MRSAPRVISGADELFSVGSAGGGTGLGSAFTRGVRASLWRREWILKSGSALKVSRTGAHCAHKVKNS